MNYFNKFIKEEYEWMYWANSDCVDMLIEYVDDKISAEEFDKYLDIFTTEATLRFVNDEYMIMQMQDVMNDYMYDVIKEYVSNKDEFLDKYKIDELGVQSEKEEMVVDAYHILTSSKENLDILIKHKLISKEKPYIEWKDSQ